MRPTARCGLDGDGSGGGESELSGAIHLEPYGLTMLAAYFRLADDRTFSRLYRSGEINPILKRWFLATPVNRCSC